MTTTQLLDSVHAEARELRPLRVLLTVLAAIPFAIGFLIALIVRAVWVVIAWCWSAAVVGFRAGKPDRVP
jgi:hypothetical protein